MKMLNIISVLFIGLLASCNKGENNTTTPPTTNEAKDSIYYYTTTPNQQQLLAKQAAAVNYATPPTNYQLITVDTSKTYQTVEGFGYTLTGGSATLINTLPSSTKASLLNELFGNNDNAIGVSYLRISLGASDLSARVFSYNDLPTGQTDVNLTNFNLADDTTDLIPVLKQILTINPNIKILASPWSPPTWMKSNGNSMGGSLLTQYYDAYARYFVKYIQAMKLKGIAIDAVTIQNEPEHGGNNPSMLMTATEQANFIKNNLGPAFVANSIATKIIVWDHNCDNPNYPINILNDAAAKQYITGSAFHLYAGGIGALSQVYNAHPDKKLYFTEQWTGKNGTFAGDFTWHMQNVMIGSMQNRASVALEWNLANDQNYGPHTTGGCTECQGAITINTNSGTIYRNVSYYIIAQMSKFVPANSVRLESSSTGNLYSVAFLLPSGKKAVVILNAGSTAEVFNVKVNNRYVATSLSAGAASTYIF